MIYIIHINRELGKIKRQRNTFQTKEQDKTSEKEQNKMDIGSLPTSVKVIKMLAELKRRMDEHSETANREMENIRKQQKEVI